MTKNIYKTSNLNIMAFADANGLIYLESIVEYDGKRPRVVAVFKDDFEVGNDLERRWLESQEKKFQDRRVFYRNEIDKALKGK